MNHTFLREAIRLSIDSMQSPGGGPFGAVIVRESQIVGHGHNCVVATHDPSAHAEVVAIRDACARLKSFTLTGCEIYASCEPCPMCLGAIYWSRLDRIYYAATRADADAAGFRDDTLYREMALPISQRSIPMEGAFRQEACAAFRIWETSENRVKY